MKITLTTQQTARKLSADKDANFSYTGAIALVEYLDEINPGVEFDACAIRCDFSEYKNLQTWAHEYFSNAWEELGMDETDCDDEEFDEKIREFILDNGHLIEFSDEFSGGVIVSSF